MMGIVVKLVFPLAAVAMLGFAVAHVVRSGQETGPADPPLSPPQLPEEEVIAAAGVVEAAGGNVAVASAVPGVVAEVFVKAGQHVAVGDRLFRLLDAASAAALQMRQAQLETARSRLARLESPPRRDELTAAAARVRAARAELAARQVAHQNAEKQHARSLIGDAELEQRKQAAVAAHAQAEAAEAEERLLKDGVPQAEKAIARAQVGEARALVAQAEAELRLLTTRAPSDGTVLQLNVRPGEAVGARPDIAPVVLGDVRELHLRVEVEEHLLGRFSVSAAATAVRRGEAGPTIALTFVRAEPLVVAKRVLSGAPGERTDRRVLPVIYKIGRGGPPVHVGQQLEAFLSVEAR